MENVRFQEKPNVHAAGIIAGAFVWIAAVQFFVVQVIAQSAWTTPYSLLHNYISDLGNTACADYLVGEALRYVCSPLHWLMNVSFFLQGVIIIVGAMLLAPAMRSGKRRRGF